MQRLAGQPLHHDEQHPVVLAAVVYRDDVRVVERRSRARLGLEPSATVRLSVNRRVQDFDRHRPRQTGVPAVADLGHTATAQ